MRPICILDPIPLGSNAATGAIKKLLFADRLQENLFHISRYPVPSRTARGRVASVDDKPTVVADWIAEQKPAFLYFRPTDDDPVFCEAAEAALERTPSTRLIMHYMDDIEERAVTVGRPHVEAMKARLSRLTSRAHRVLTISEEMAATIGARHGVPAQAVSNAPDLDCRPRGRVHLLRGFSPERPFRLRYFGSVSPDMNQASIRMVASAAAFLGFTLPIRFEAFVPSWCRPRVAVPSWGAEHVWVSGQVPEAELASGLANADALLIAYNFDPLSLSYVRDSLGNKTGDYVNASRPILAFGPPVQATMSMLSAADASEFVGEPDFYKLQLAIQRLVLDFRRREKLVENAWQLAERGFNLAAMRGRFEACFV